MIETFVFQANKEWNEIKDSGKPNKSFSQIFSKNSRIVATLISHLFINFLRFTIIYLFDNLIIDWSKFITFAYRNND